MPFRQMSLLELSKLIGMDARTVHKLADKGTLPGQYVNGAWRFHSAEMIDWLQHELHYLDVRDLKNLERATASDLTRFSVCEMISAAGIDLNLPARSRRSVLEQMVKLAERTGLVYDPESLLEAIIQREELHSTALRGGFAFPHPRRPLPYATQEPLICVGRVMAGVPFSAPDGKLTDLFVLILNHEDRAHLHVLARLSMLFTSTLPDDLREAETPEDVLTLFHEGESQFIEKQDPPARR